MIVGGNIDGFTRTMTTAIALETSKGDLPLAMGLGVVLVALVLAINAAAWGARRWSERQALIMRAPSSELPAGARPGHADRGAPPPFSTGSA